MTLYIFLEISIFTIYHMSSSHKYIKSICIYMYNLCSLSNQLKWQRNN